MGDVVKLPSEPKRIVEDYKGFHLLIEMDPMTRKYHWVIEKTLTTTIKYEGNASCVEQASKHARSLVDKIAGKGSK